MAIGPLDASCRAPRSPSTPTRLLRSTTPSSLPVGSSAAETAATAARSSTAAAQAFMTAANGCNARQHTPAARRALRQATPPPAYCARVDGRRRYMAHAGCCSARHLCTLPPCASHWHTCLPFPVKSQPHTSVPPVRHQLPAASHRPACRHPPTTSAVLQNKCGGPAKNGSTALSAQGGSSTFRHQNRRLFSRWYGTCTGGAESWASSAPMPQARRQLRSVLLPLWAVTLQRDGQRGQQHVSGRLLRAAGGALRSARGWAERRGARALLVTHRRMPASPGEWCSPQAGHTWSRQTRLGRGGRRGRRHGRAAGGRAGGHLPSQQPWRRAEASVTHCPTSGWSSSWRRSP